MDQESAEFESPVVAGLSLNGTPKLSTYGVHLSPIYWRCRSGAGPPGRPLHDGAAGIEVPQPVGIGGGGSITNWRRWVKTKPALTEGVTHSSVSVHVPTRMTLSDGLWTYPTTGHSFPLQYDSQTRAYGREAAHA